MTPLPGKAALDALLTRPLEGAARLVLSHRRRRSFRWLSLLELPVKLVFLIFLLFGLMVASIILWVSGEGDRNDGADEGSALPGLSVRFFDYWHELALLALDQDGATLEEISVAPPSAAEANGIVASVLAAADRQGLVVVETLGVKMSETLEVWYGGQPLMSHPTLRDAETAAALLRESGFQLRDASDFVELITHAPRRSRPVALLLLSLALAASPALAWFRSFRRALGNLWMDLRGVDPQRRILQLNREGRLRLRDKRGSREEQLLLLDGRELIGIGFSATLGYDRDVTRRPAALRLVTQNETHTLPYDLKPQVGRALRDWLLVKAIAL